MHGAAALLNDLFLKVRLSVSMIYYPLDNSFSTAILIISEPCCVLGVVDPFGVVFIKS